MTGAQTAVTTPSSAMLEFLRRSGLVPDEGAARWAPLTGGVSSDLWRVDVPGRTFCVKAALPTLRVADTWHAPVDRNAVEVAWLRFAAEQVPGVAPAILADDPVAGLFAMEFLDPVDHPVWKAELMAGRVVDTTAAAVGDVVGRLAAVSASAERRDEMARRFATDENFHRLRIEPYLLATARRRPEVAERLQELADRTQSTRLALVHGDVSPKNILLGPRGPVLLDAECAWWGDPAFDAAFCLNHLLLKALVADQAQRVDRARRLATAAGAWWSSYLGHVSWEPVDELRTRVTDLLPALLLARIDGTSPVEYVTAEEDRTLVREVARELLSSTDPDRGPEDVFTVWQDALAA